MTRARRLHCLVPEEERGILYGQMEVLMNTKIAKDEDVSGFVRIVVNYQHGANVPSTHSILLGFFIAT